jgi:uncharacterized protein (UPF0147 family)
MRRLYFSMMPTNATDVGSSALIAFVDDVDGAVDVRVVYSRTQAHELARSLSDPKESMDLASHARASRLPDLDETSLSVQIPAFSAMRVFNLIEKLQQLKSTPPQFRSIVPCLLVFETTTANQAERFLDLAPNPDFMGVALDEDGDPEVVIGFSRKDAKNYLRARADWNLETKTLARWHANIDASGLPRTVAMPRPVKITGFVAGMIYEISALECLRRTNN